MPFEVYADGIDLVIFEEFGAGAAALHLRDEVERIIKGAYPSSQIHFTHGGSRAKGTMVKEDHDLDLVGQQIGHHHRVGAIWHPGNVDTGALLQRLHDDLGRTVADAVGQLAGIGLGEVDQRLHRLVRLVGVTATNDAKLPIRAIGVKSLIGS